MCGTARSGKAETCSYCGYIFEDQLAMNTNSVARTEATEAPFTPVETNSLEEEAETEEEIVIESQPLVASKGPRGVLQGTLVLTKKRLALVNPADVAKLSDALDVTLQKAPLVIPIDSIDSVSGQRGLLRTTLVVNWHAQSGTTSTIRTEFMQRARPPTAGQLGINDWIPLIEKQVWGEPEEDTAASSDLSELESRVLEKFTASQWVGYFQLTRELEEKYETSIDPDDLDKVLEKLVREKILEKEKVGEFFRKVSSGSKG
jgi:hypothetical protein